jgi:hypothetical protein
MMKLFFRRKTNNETSQQNTTTLDPASAEVVKDIDRVDDIAVAISLAVHLYLNKLQEHENNMITFHQFMQPYSPWSSKIYGLRQQPMYRPGLQSTKR